ncbi:MAG: DUF4326 domain-containing protein [Sedimentisphaerales bacterium]|nr:DUF4326 domain-containing protein [Sedimentisphaerales bacterium]
MKRKKKRQRTVGEIMAHIGDPADRTLFEPPVRVVHVRKEAFDVYIGRRSGGFPESIWANPFKLGKHGNRRQILAKYREMILSTPPLYRKLPHLRGKVLGCWCAPQGGLTKDDPLKCHGQVLAQLVAELDTHDR